MPSGRKKSKVCGYLLLANVDNDTAGNVWCDVDILHRRPCLRYSVTSFF